MRRCCSSLSTFARPSSGSPRSRVLTSTKTTVRPAMATRSRCARAVPRSDNRIDAGAPPQAAHPVHPNRLDHAPTRARRTSETRMGNQAMAMRGATVPYNTTIQFLPSRSRNGTRSKWRESGLTETRLNVPRRSRARRQPRGFDRGRERNAISVSSIRWRRGVRGAERPYRPDREGNRAWRGAPRSIA